MSTDESEPCSTEGLLLNLEGALADLRTALKAEREEVRQLYCALNYVTKRASDSVTEVEALQQALADSAAEIAAKRKLAAEAMALLRDIAEHEPLNECACAPKGAGGCARCILRRDITDVRKFLDDNKLRK